MCPTLYFSPIYVDELDSLSLKAIRCLAHYFTPKNKKKAIESSKLDVPYITAEVPVSLLHMCLESNVSSKPQDIMCYHFYA